VVKSKSCPALCDAALGTAIVGLTAVILTFPPRSETIDRWRGGMLLALYGAYVLAVLRI